MTQPGVEPGSPAGFSLESRGASEGRAGVSRSPLGLLSSLLNLYLSDTFCGFNTGKKRNVKR